MNDTRKRCPVCKLDGQEILARQDGGDKVTYKCHRCGQFTVSRTAEAVVGRSAKSARLSGWLRERTMAGIEIPMLTTMFIEEVLRTLPDYKPLEKQQKLLRAIEGLTEYPGQEVILIPEYETALAWAENEREFEFYVKSLMERGFLAFINPEERAFGDPLYSLYITSHGWEYLETIQSNQLGKSQAFVAMSFDAGLRSVYDNAIAPAIEAAGYRPYRVDATAHLERIDIKIIAEIRQSRFLVADVTQQKAGVYYEAGFAYGLGIPVIWCVRKDDLHNVHFDTRQYNHVLWDTEKELREQLENFILATIGAHMTQPAHRPDAG
jgi:nucleoside 2-deoxyribosyltransferase